MNAGDSLLVVMPGESLDTHLWIILSDPAVDAERVLLVNLTSWRQDHDQACILEPGDHPFIRHRTCVNYPAAKVHRASELDTLLVANKIKLLDPLDGLILRRMREGAALSSRMALELAEILFDQGLVE